jgi:hypothetical protein
MSTIVSARASPALLQRWRQQVARQQRRHASQGPRPLAAIGYQVHGPVTDGLVDLRRVVYLSLFDELRGDGRLATRVAGFTSAIVPWGIKIGGPEQSRFEKDLGWPPAYEAKGRRFDLAHSELLTTALDLDRSLERHERFPHLPRLRQPRWPTLWATFESRAAFALHGDGPEFEALARQGNDRKEDLLKANHRVIGGLMAFPLAFVSHAWRQFTAVYADLKSVPKRQVIALDHPAKSLCGFSGAIEFDLFHTRFSAATPSPIPRPHRRARSFAG